MLSNCFHWFRARSVSKRGSTRARPVRVFRPRLEALEERALLATVTWDGGSTLTNSWSDKVNWVGDVAPVAGDDLVFPDNAAQKTNVNDIKFVLFNSLIFSGSGYTISAAGPSAFLNVDFGINNSATSGANSYNGPIQFRTGVAGPNGNDGKGSKEVKEVAPAENRWGAFLVWQSFHLPAGAEASNWRRALYLIAAGLSFGLGIAGVRARHRMIRSDR